MSRTLSEYWRPNLRPARRKQGIMFWTSGTKMLQNSWWVVRVSIPAPWDSSQIVRARPSLSACPGQRLPWIRQRPPMSSRISFPGYMIGYTASEVGCQAFFKFVALMTSNLRSVSRSHLEAVVMESPPARENHAASPTYLEMFPAIQMTRKSTAAIPRPRSIAIAMRLDEV